MAERLYISKLIKSDLAVSSDKASIVFEQLQKNLQLKVKTTIDFSNIKSLTTAFLNIAIGELYRYENKETLNEFINIDVDTLSKLQINKVKLVIENSRAKYNPELKKRIDEVTLHGEID
ncbi:STAS-like domain-containing protein [Enterococcus faecalis]|nr:STAS-like domain-containing protein [Enterococcus faecalis]